MLPVFYPCLALIKIGACVTVVTIAGVDLLEAYGAGSHKLGHVRVAKMVENLFPAKRFFLKRRREGEEGGGINIYIYIRRREKRLPKDKRQ